MNFNNSSLPPAPKKGNNRKIVKIIIITAVASIGLFVGVEVMAGYIKFIEIANSSPSSSYEIPSVAEVTKWCTDTLRNRDGAIPPKLSVNTCVGTVFRELR